MKFSKIIWHGAVALAAGLLLTAMPMQGGILTNLPTIRVNGKIMYYYDAQAGDNIYTIADKLGVSVEQIRANNPSVADGVKPRMRLLFPSDIATDQTGNSAGPLTHIVKKGESVYGIAHQYGMTVDELLALNPMASQGLRPNQRLLLSSSAQPAASAVESEMNVETAEVIAPVTTPVPTPKTPSESAVSSEPASEPAVAPEREMSQQEVVDAEVVAAEPVDIAVILPFMLNEGKMSHQTKLYTEFYKGVLLAATQSNQEGRTPLRIHAFDSAANLDSVRAIMLDPRMQEMELILAPENAAQLAAVTASAPKDAMILNLFAVKDSSYLTNPAMIQANIPRDAMYNLAIEGFVSRYDNATPVFLNRKGGKTDKEEFTEMLKTALNARGIAYQTVQFDGYLSDADLEQVDPSLENYVFIPASGNRDEFSRIVHGLKALGGRSENPDAVQIFGYPEWTTFRGDQYKELCDLNATIFSRYNTLDRSPEVRSLDGLFRESYGDGLIDKQMPVLGILGYDTGRFVIDAMRQKATSGTMPTDFDGLQSGLRLTLAPDGGFYNNALFLIRYAPGEIVSYQLIAPNSHAIDYVD